MIDTLKYANSINEIDKQLLPFNIRKLILEEYYEKIFVAYHQNLTKLEYYPLTPESYNEIYKNSLECECLLDELQDLLYEMQKVENLIDEGWNDYYDD